MRLKDNEKGWTVCAYERGTTRVRIIAVYDNKIEALNHYNRIKAEYGPKAPEYPACVGPNKERCDPDA